MVLDDNPLNTIAILVPVVICALVIVWTATNKAFGGGPAPVVITAVTAALAAAVTVATWRKCHPVVPVQSPPDTLDPPRS